MPCSDIEFDISITRLFKFNFKLRQRKYDIWRSYKYYRTTAVFRKILYAPNGR